MIKWSAMIRDPTAHTADCQSLLLRITRIIHDGSSRNRVVATRDRRAELTDRAASPLAWLQVWPRPGASSPRLRGGAPFPCSWREERISHWILTSVSAIA